MKKLIPTSNIANKVRNTSLPSTKPLWPLFEVISNSIHAIHEASQKKGKIKIFLIRNGAEEILSIQEDVEKYSIHTFHVEDNGVGLNDNNLNSFVEADSDKKIDIGGKGVGRFICLKAFRKLEIESNFKSKGSIVKRQFQFKNTKEGFHNFKEEVLNKKTSIGTKVTLDQYREKYIKHAPTETKEIAIQIIEHFLLYFLTDSMPEIVLYNQNNTTIRINNLFEREVKAQIQKDKFEFCDSNFEIFIVKSYLAKSHKFHFCAHNRSVKNEPLYKKITDITKYGIEDSEGTRFYYQVYLIGEVLDENVNLERTGFKFSEEEEDIPQSNEITLSKLRTEAIYKVEELLFDYLEKVRNEKMERYIPIIDNELPHYKYILKRYEEKVRKIPPKMNKEKLDFELYKLESEWRTEVKKEKLEIIDGQKDITNLDEYKERYETFLSDFNEVGKSDLARYVVHRKAVIDLLDKLIEINSEEKFTDEDLIHSIFFPIRTTSDEIPHEKQNLWLLDERLTFHSFLSSDKTFNSNKAVSSKSIDRTDLLIYNEAIAFSESKSEPHNSFIIVEFKKPMRNDYTDDDPKKNPIQQAEKYIKRLIDGKVKSRGGRQIIVSDKTPFYVYIVCDITPTLKEILESREYDKTADGLGYFKMKSKYYSAYIEVVPFNKILKDAKERNRILFDKLGII